MPNEIKPEKGQPEREAKVVVFHIDKAQHKLQPPITGSKLYSLAAVGAGYDLYLEAKGPGDDLFIANEETEVPVNNGDKVYSAQSSLNPGSGR